MSFEFIADVIEKDNHLKEVMRAMKELNSLDVLVGIPDNSAGREGKLSNAALLYIHTNGSPLNNIPVRPVIEPAIYDSKEKIAELLGEAAKSATDGNISGIQQNLQKAGQAGETAAKNWFTDPKNGWAENSTITLQGTKKYKKDGKTKQFIKAKKSNRPLIDTGALRRSITYVVRKKG